MREGKESVRYSDFMWAFSSLEANIGFGPRDLQFACHASTCVTIPQAISKLHDVGMTKESGVLYNNLAATSLQTKRPAAALHYCTLALEVGHYGP
jgi:hypothetical protein